MNANELMLGNYVEFKNNVRKVEAICYPYNHLTSLRNKALLEQVETVELKPIPLTEKWLLTFGAETDRGVYRLPNFKGYFVLLNLKGSLFYEHNIHQVQMCKIQYVHQLQNLYFFFANNHLQLVEPK